MSLPARRLYRSRKQRILGGVCGGLGEYFGVDPVLIRLAWVLFCFVWGVGLLLYIIAWIIIPPAPDYVEAQSVPSGTPPQATTPQTSPGYPGIATIFLIILGVVLVLGGVSSVLSSLLSPFSTFLLPIALMVFGALIVLMAIFLMRR